MPLFGGPPDIAKLEAKRDVNGLIKALGHKEGSIGRSAAAALARIGADPKPLVAHLTDGNLGMVVNVERALVALGAPAVPALAAVLKDGSPKMRCRAARILGQIGGPTAVDPLVAALGDQDDSVRDLSAAALYAVGFHVVRVALKDRSDDVRKAADEALAKGQAQKKAEQARKAEIAAKVAAEAAERNKPQFYRTPCDLASHEWRPLGHWGHHYECKRCDATLELETGIVWAMVQDGSSIRIGQMERWFSGPNSMDGGWRPVTAPVPAPPAAKPAAKAKPAAAKAKPAAAKAKTPK